MLRLAKDLISLSALVSNIGASDPDVAMSNSADQRMDGRPVDGGSVDGPVPVDSGSVDGPVPVDSGSVDGGSVDSGSVDGPVPVDSGSVDGGCVDSGLNRSCSIVGLSPE